jgi:hypothetical protein
MKGWFIIAGCCWLTTALGGDPKYPVSAIPAELKENVDAVVRDDQMIFTILADNRARLYSHYVVTIFNSRAKHYAERADWYSRLRKITAFEGLVYNAEGALIKKLKSSEISDHSTYDGGGTLHSDDRIKSADLTQSTYPYTVEFEIEVEYKYLYEIDDSYIISGEKVAVQKASYQLIFPPLLAPRYKTCNIDQAPTREKLKDNTESLTWKFENLKPLKFEPFGPHKGTLLPRIMAAPGKFEFDGYPGSMETWDSFGNWVASLNKGRDQLPEASKQKIKQLTAQAKTDEEKVKILYEYMQSKTRYVGIQMGIGGYQPFEASVVDKMGYGDCKALSNYMVTILQEAGVKAHYVLIMAGKNPAEIVEDFPSSQFNHAIAMVPVKNDTLWLECTSQTNPFAYQGTFTGNRKALIIMGDGAKIVKTQRYAADQNVQSRHAEVYVEKTGNAKATIKTVYSGLQYENDHLNFILGNQYDDQKKWVQNNTSIPSFDINSFSITQKKERLPSATVKLDLTLNRFASISGKRLFLTPNLMNRSTVIPEKVENRKTNVVLNFPYSDFDTVRYHLPEEIYPEFLPQPAKIKSRFGEYESHFILDQGTLVYIRKMKMYEGSFPPESYQELTDFYRNINKADNIRMVFLSKT